MTYEEFKKCLDVRTIVDDGFVEVRVSLKAVRSRMLPKSIFNVAIFEDEIADVVSQEMWHFFQHEFGRTDDDLRRAYNLGLRNGLRFDPPKFETVYQELSKYFHDPQNNHMIFKK